MTANDLNAMPLDDLRRYMLAHRDNQLAFQVYIDRSKFILILGNGEMNN
jgi:hypothetical protein